MDVILVIIEDCGYMGAMVCGYRTYSVFSSIEKVKDFMDTKYIQVEELAKRQDAHEVNHYYRCTTKNHEEHYIWTMKKKLV